MKKAKWLVELDLFTDTEEELIKAIKRSGREVKTLQYIPFDDNLVKRSSEGYEGNNLDVIVEKVSKAAENEWKEYQI